MDVVVIDTPQLGDRSYLVHDGEVALVVDPQRDTDRIEQAAAYAGVRITHVAETHLHNDYLTGGLVLARSQNAVYLVNAADEVQFEHQPITDGETIPVGSLRVTAVATPGHTHTHLSYIVTAGEEQAVFSGGSLLYGSVGRLTCGSRSGAVDYSGCAVRRRRRIKVARPKSPRRSFTRPRSPDRSWARARGCGYPSRVADQDFTPHKGQEREPGAQQAHACFGFGFGSGQHDGGAPAKPPSDW